MANPVITRTAEGFTLKSTWSVKYITDPIDIIYGWPSTPSQPVNFDLSAITKGSTVISATLNTTLNKAAGGDAHAIANGIDVPLGNGANVKNVTSWLSSMSGGTFGVLPVSYTWHADGGTTVGYTRCAFSDIELTVTYKLPNSTGTVTVTTVTAGGTITLNVAPVDSSYTHRVEWKIGDHTVLTETLAAGLTSSSLVTDLDMCQYVPNSASGQGLVTLTTYSGGTQVGAPVTYTFTFNVPSDVVPTAGALSVSPLTTGAPRSWSNIYVQGFSRINLSLANVAGARGSTIRSVMFSGWSSSANGSASGNAYVGTSGLLTVSGNYAIQAVVTDSRGRTCTVLAPSQITVTPYAPPSISSVVAQRCDENGRTSDVGTYVNVTVWYTYAMVNNLNSTANVIRYRIAGESSDRTVADPAFTYGAPSKIGDGLFSADASHSVTVYITDAIGNQATATVAVPTAAYVLHFLDGGKSVGIGMAAKALDQGEAGAVSINSGWNVYIGGNNIKQVSGDITNINGQISGINGSIGTINSDVSDLRGKVSALENKTTVDALKQTLGIGTSDSVIVREQRFAVPETSDIFTENINLQDGDVWVGSLLIGAITDTDILAWFDNDTDATHYRSYMRYRANNTVPGMNYIGFASASGTAHIKFTISRIANAVIMEGQSMRGDNAISDFVVEKQADGARLIIRSNHGVAANAQLRMRKLL